MQEHVELVSRATAQAGPVEEPGRSGSADFLDLEKTDQILSYLCEISQCFEDGGR